MSYLTTSPDTIVLESTIALSKNIQFHKVLNPKLWENDLLRSEVRDKIISDSDLFVKFLNDPKIKVQDITLTGSNASYNYTLHSDIDVHLLVDYKELVYSDTAADIFATKGYLWSKTYHPKIYGFDIEFYAQDTDDPVVANGIYNVKSNDWIKYPKPINHTYDALSVKSKVRRYVHAVTSLLKSKSYTLDSLHDLFDRINKLRKNGLSTGGEFSVENLTYKVLRSTGYIQKLVDAQVELEDKELSLK